MTFVQLQILAGLVLSAPQKTATEGDSDDVEGRTHPAVQSLRPSQLETPRVPQPGLLQMRGASVRRLTLREKLDDLSFAPRGFDLSPKPTAVAWPAANPHAIPRVSTGVGMGHSVVLGTVEMYARTGAAVGLDATPRAEGDDRKLTVVPQGQFGVRVRPTQRVRIGVDIARVGPVSFDPVGDEFRALASLRWRFSLVPRR
jgi:hypothetical protein